MDKIDKSEKLLEQAELQQLATAEFLSDVDKANIQAREAVNRGMKTLQEAKETLQKLSGNFYFFLHLFY